MLLEGLPAGGKAFEMPNHPKDASLGSRPLKLSGAIYIEASDFREVDDKNYYGLAPGKEVGLLGCGVNITCKEVVRAAGGEISHLVASVDVNRVNKPKGHLHWLSAETAVAAEVRVYDVLFSPEDPEAAAKELGAADAAEADEDDDGEDDEPAAGEPLWLKTLNPNSLVVEHGFVEPSLAADAKPPKAAVPTFQFQRVGFFAVDSDSTPKKPVFNRVVALKEDKEKGKL